MTAEAFTFVELTGSERSIVLRNRALPYRPVAFGGKQRIKKTTYPGNPVSTIQILGPEESTIELKGTWKSRFVSEDASLWGFDDLIVPGFPVTAEILTEAFNRLRISGNQIEMSWGPEIRRGVIVDFTPNYQRVEDIEWTITFDPSQRGTRVAPRASAPVEPTVEIDAALLALLDLGSQIPPIILPNVTGPIILAQNLAQEGALALTGSIGSISGIPIVTPAQFQSVASNSETLRDACVDIRTLTVDQTIEDFIAVPSVSDTLSAETWRRAYAAAALVLAASAIRARESVRARVADEVIATVIVRDNQTLRDLALEYFGSSDAWTTIADFNGYASSDVGTGIQIQIPRQGWSSSGSGASS
jgi:hypothetical protein